MELTIRDYYKAAKRTMNPALLTLSAAYSEGK